MQQLHVSLSILTFMHISWKVLKYLYGHFILSMLQKVVQAQQYISLNMNPFSHYLSSLHKNICELVVIHSRTFV